MSNLKAIRSIILIIYLMLFAASTFLTCIYLNRTSSALFLFAILASSISSQNLYHLFYNYIFIKLLFNSILNNYLNLYLA